MGSRRGDPPGRARAARDRVRDRRGRGNVLRPEDRPAHAGHARPLVADGDDPGGRADAAAVRPHLHGAGQRRAHADRHPPCAARLARALHRDHHRALRRRLPVLARAGAGAGDPGRRGPPRGGRTSCAAGSTRRATGSTSTSATRRSGSGSATPSSRRRRSRSSTATASRTSRSRCASAAASSRR